MDKDIEGETEELKEIVYGGESNEIMDEGIDEGDSHEVKDDDDDGFKEDLITPYICTECGSIFTSKRSYEKHLSAIHRMRKIYHCQICSSKFYNFKSFRRHYSLHNSKNQWECSLCEMHFERKENGERHLCNVHQIYKIECELCGKGFAFRADAIEHLKTNHRDFDISGCHSFIDDKNQVVTLNFCCKKCNSTFLTQQQLTAHEKMNHLQPLITNRSLRRPGDRKKVIRLIAESNKMKSFVSQLAKKISDRNNLGPNSKSCKVCKKTFNSNWHLNRHLKVHFGTNSQRVQVNTEPNTFENGVTRNMKSLRLEIKSENGITKTTTEMKSWKEKHCPLCNKMFNRSYNFRRHLRVVHKINASNITPNILNPSRNLSKSIRNPNSPKSNSISQRNNFNSSRNFITLPTSFSTLKHLDLSPNKAGKLSSLIATKPLQIRKPTFLHKILPKRIPEVKLKNILKQPQEITKKPEPDTSEIVSSSLPEISVYKIPLPEDESMLDSQMKLKPHLCKICGIRYTRKLDMDHHVESKHFNKCSYCNRTFSEKLFLQNHLRNQHLDKLFVCTQCEKVFLTSYHLDQHTKYVHDKSMYDASETSGNLEKYQCPKCFKILSSASGLRRHRKNVHKEEFHSPNI